ncbi:MAG: hydroxysqualene dehydroxylase HpnE [Pirellulaceae bacterium]
MKGSRPKVAIVGGGLAGMAAAMALSSRNLKVTLLESRSKTGGRAGSFLDPQSGVEIDYCQHVAMGCCTNLLHLLDQAGQLGSWKPYRELLFIGPDGGCYPFASSSWMPAPLHFTKAFAGLKYLSTTVRQQVARGMWKLMRLPDADAEKWRSMRDWLNDAGQSPTAIKAFWDVFLISALGEQTQRVAVAPARKVFVDGFLSHRRAADVWVPQQPLSILFGEQLPQCLIDRGVDLRTSTQVKRVQRIGRQAVSLLISDGSTIPFDFLIVAIPWHQLPKVFGDDEEILPNLRQAGAIPASPITGIHLWSDRPLTDQPHLVFVDKVSQWLFRPAYASDSPHRVYHQVVVSASRDLPSRERLIEIVWEELRMLLPHAKEANLVDAKVVTDPKSVFSVSVETERERPESKTRLENLWLAGDWTCTGWPATMESAVISGFRAADGIATAIGDNRSWEQPPLERSRLSRWMIR